MTTAATYHMTPVDRPFIEAMVAAPWLNVPHRRPFAARFVLDDSQMSDVVDHVRNTEYIRWLDRVAELHSDACGYTRQWLLNEGMMWFVARHEIDYRAECRAGDALVAITWVRSFDRVKSWRDYLVVRPSDEMIVCEASTLWVLVDLATRRPIRIESSMADRFDPLTPGTQRARTGSR